jgi:hypothetical protein
LITSTEWKHNKYQYYLKKVELSMQVIEINEVMATWKLSRGITNELLALLKVA